MEANLIVPIDCISTLPCQENLTIPCPTNSLSVALWGRVNITLQEREACGTAAITHCLVGVLVQIREKLLRQVVECNVTVKTKVNLTILLHILRLAIRCLDKHAILIVLPRHVQRKLIQLIKVTDTSVLVMVIHHK